MDVQKIIDGVREAVMGEMSREFREFRADVRGQLEGFRLAIDTMNKRLDSIESRLSNVENDVRALNLRLDETNKRIDGIYTGLVERIRELGGLKAEVAALRARQELEDLIERVRRLEEKVFA